MKFFTRKKQTSRRIGPKMYYTYSKKTDREKLKEDWNKVNADMWTAFKKYQHKKANRPADKDERYNDQFIIF